MGNAKGDSIRVVQPWEPDSSIPEVVHRRISVRDYANKPRRPFINRPDVAWTAKAIGLGVTPARVALAIAFRAGMTGNDRAVRPNQQDYEIFGVARWQRCRGIQALEAAGLIRKLNHGTHKLPEVEIVLPPETDTTDE